MRLSATPRPEAAIHSCPNCGSNNLSVFYKVERVPVHSVTLLTSYEAASRFPTADITLGFCADCGFVFNTAFDPAVHEYSRNYESTQSFSTTFNSFHHRLAQDLIR